MGTDFPLGEFTCAVMFESVRPPTPVIREEGGATYVVQRDYEIAFRTVLRFADGAELPVRARLFGELSEKVLVRDSAGKAIHLSGFTQGRSEILDPEGHVIFQGRYYDTRTFQPLAGDDALTPVGTRICDHWISAPKRCICSTKLRGPGPKRIWPMMNSTRSTDMTE